MKAAELLFAFGVEGIEYGEEFVRIILRTGGRDNCGLEDLVLTPSCFLELARKTAFVIHHTLN
jgi:hypothetical protein